jgi:hypothetical protein
MNIARNHVELLMDFGYTEPEAKFLYVVATHSGYFILRQYLDFAGARRGKRSSRFAQKILNNGHAAVRDYMGYGAIYHLFSRSLYGQIEKDNLRNRRAHSFDFIRTRLVLLDFILSNQEVQYLETEPDKVKFFCEDLDIPKVSLPAKIYEGAPGTRPTVRYFVDKFPLFLATLTSCASPVVTFSYVDSGAETISGFLTHLAAYTPLFRRLRSFSFVYISPRDTEFDRAAQAFRRSVQEPLESDLSREVLRYFEVRKRFESRQYIVPVTEDFEFLNEAKTRFQGDRFERLYSAWSSGALRDQELRDEFPQADAARTISFKTYLVARHRSHLDEIKRKRVNVA